MKIAILLYSWPSMNRVYILSLCNMLLELGHDVHIFNFFTHDDVPFEQTKVNKNLKIHSIYQVSLLFRVINKFLGLSHRLLPFLRNRVLEYRITLRKRKDFKTIVGVFKQYPNFDFSIGIEKGGVICAHQLYNLFRTPYYYYSLELYIEDHPLLVESNILRAMRELEIAAHKEAVGTIIADKDRKDALYKAGNIDSTKSAFFLPISFIENENEGILLSTQEKKSSKKIILNFGYNRLPDSFLISLINKLPDDYLFLMHNYDTAYHEKIAQNNSLKNIEFSNKFKTEHEVTIMIFNSFVGLCWYQNETTNDRLTAFSSEKTARYLAAGIPIIANVKTNFSRLFSLIECGIAVDSPAEFIDALKMIDSNYKYFSQRAKEAFDKYFKLANYQQSLNDFLCGSIIEYNDKKLRLKN